MTNLLAKGIDWFNDKVEANLVEPVVLTTSAGNRSIQATVLEPESIVGGEGLKASTDKWIFLVDKKHLLGVDIKRGVRLSRLGFNYEAILDNRFITDYNDPNHSRVAISAKLINHTPT